MGRRVYHAPVFSQAIARKLQEKEMKEERKRQKQLEANFEEEYFEDHGGGESTTGSCVFAACMSFHVCVCERECVDLRGRVKDFHSTALESD